MWRMSLLGIGYKLQAATKEDYVLLLSYVNFTRDLLKTSPLKSDSLRKTQGIWEKLAYLQICSVITHFFRKFSKP